MCYIYFGAGYTLYTAKMASAKRYTLRVYSPISANMYIASENCKKFKIHHNVFLSNII